MKRRKTRPSVWVATLLMPCALAACSYDESVELCPTNIALAYPEGGVQPYAGARVELKDATASVYVDSTNASGTAHFVVPPGVYEASSSSTFITPDYRYFFNGVRSRIVISPDSANEVTLPLKMSRKRIVH